MPYKETSLTNYVPPLLLGYMGPPGGGKTKSALRTAEGMQRVRGGEIIVGDTEKGRALKYLRGPRNPNGHEFKHFEISPPFKPEAFIDFIRDVAKRNPAAIIIDSLSDEHEGEGGYLDWHDEEVPRSGGNEWAAWKKPSMSRRKLVAGIQQIDVPLIFTFRAREKTKQVQDGNRKKVVPIGYVPVAPAEIVHTLDLTCLLPPRSNGVPLWQSPREGEDFVLKYPEFLARFITRGMVLEEEFGEALAKWQIGKLDEPPSSAANGKRTPEQLVDGYIASLAKIGRLDSGEDDREGGLSALMEWQAAEGTAKFVAGIRERHPALYDRILTANQQRARELQAPDDDDGDDEFPAGGDE